MLCFLVPSVGVLCGSVFGKGSLPDTACNNGTSQILAKNTFSQRGVCVSLWYNFKFFRCTVWLLSLSTCRIISLAFDFLGDVSEWAGRDSWCYWTCRVSKSYEAFV